MVLQASKWPVFPKAPKLARPVGRSEAQITPKARHQGQQGLGYRFGVVCVVWGVKLQLAISSISHHPRYHPPLNRAVQPLLSSPNPSCTRHGAALSLLLHIHVCYSPVRRHCRSRVLLSVEHDCDTLISADSPVTDPRRAQYHHVRPEPRYHRDVLAGQQVASRLRLLPSYDEPHTIRC